MEKIHKAFLEIRQEWLSRGPLPFWTGRWRFMLGKYAPRGAAQDKYGAPARRIAACGQIAFSGQTGTMTRHNDNPEAFVLAATLLPEHPRRHGRAARMPQTGGPGPNIPREGA
jgi:hypothetical protein